VTDQIMSSTGASLWGTVSYAAAIEGMGPGQIRRAQRLVPDAKSVIVAVFPYFAGYAPGNMALYSRGQDYHTVVRDRLEPAADALCAHYGGTFLPLVDASPLPEKQLAAAAGLGVMGSNTLLITPENGSFVFIGCILTDVALETSLHPLGHCLNCGKCVAACPTGALSVRDGEPTLDRSRCLSALTQKKGELTPEEIRLLRRGEYAWGCDVCQRVCPENEKIPLTRIGEFLPGEGYGCFFGDLTLLTEEEFAQKYQNKAFAWRGRDVIVRNMEILNGTAQI